MARGRQGGSRFGTFLVLSGIAGVLGVTFVAGVWTGRHWPLLTGSAKPPTTVEATAGKRERGQEERARPAGNLPALTFYQELKAPLTAPPPSPPRPAKPARPAEPAAAAAPAPTPSPAAAPARVEMPPRPEATREGVPPKSEAAAPAEAGARFTVQVAAYNARPPAETLRAVLAAAGHDARIVEAGTPTGVRYRVQVGAFASREAAQEAGARLAAERAFHTFVTTR